MTWNIWHVKNRWLRAALMWLAVALLAALCLVAAPIAIVVLAVIGAASGVRELFRTLRGGEWQEIFRVAWAALTAKDQPA